MELCLLIGSRHKDSAKGIHSDGTVPRPATCNIVYIRPTCATIRAAAHKPALFSSRGNHRGKLFWTITQFVTLILLAVWATA